MVVLRIQIRTQLAPESGSGFGMQIRIQLFILFVIIYTQQHTNVKYFQLTL
jgi:hypothetical protein